MAYNRSNYNPDALPAHFEPDQAAAMLSGSGGGKSDRDRDRDRDRRSGGSRPQPAPPQIPRYDSAGRPPPSDPRYDDRRGSGRQSGPSYAAAGSPTPGNYGYDRNNGPPPPANHGRPPITNYRPPPTPMLPRDGNDKDALWPMFRQVDKDGSGQLSERELRSALVNGDWTAFDPHTVRMMIRMFDADRNGSISFDEFCGLWSFLSAWRNLFDRFDADRSGNISLSEFQEALVNFGYRLSPQFVRILFKTYDRRSENAMSFDLFVQACISLKRMTDVFKKYDEDRDGYITLSFEEFLTEILRQLD